MGVRTGMVATLALAAASATYACGGIVVPDVDAAALDASPDGPKGEDAAAEADLVDAAPQCPDYLTTTPCEGGVVCGQESACVLEFEAGAPLPSAVGCFPTSQCADPQDLCGCIAACVCGAGDTCVEAQDGYYVACQAH